MRQYIFFIYCVFLIIYYEVIDFCHNYLLLKCFNASAQIVDCFVGSDSHSLFIDISIFILAPIALFSYGNNLLSFCN